MPWRPSPGSGAQAAPGLAFVSIGNVVPPKDNPPPGKYFGFCGLRDNRPVREVAPQRPILSGNTNPLTGLPIDPALLQKRIFIARYGNEPAVRNYFGISAPDLVFEELMDSLNTTRFTTVWLGGDAPQIGPLRSFRSTTIQVAQMFDAPMASSGAVGPNQFFAYAAGIEDLDERCSSKALLQQPQRWRLSEPGSDHQRQFARFPGSQWAEQGCYGQATDLQRDAARRRPARQPSRGPLS